MIKKLTLATAVSITTAFAALPAMADYPEKAVEFVVPFPPGDLEDILTRMIADEFQSTYNVPAAVVNKPGAGGGPFPGAAYVADAPADGYTIGSFVSGVPLVGPHVGIPSLSPNPFEPVGIFVTYPFVIASSKSAPFSTMEELAKHAKDESVVLGHFGSFLLPTQVTFAVADKLGFEYGSEAAFDALDCNTLASGDADVINTTLQLIQPCLDEVNVLASIGPSRIPLTPDSRTVSEIVPDLDISLWNGLFVKEGTPADVREKLAAVSRKVMASSEAKELAANTGALIYWMGADESAAQLDKDGKTLAVIESLLGE